MSNEQKKQEEQKTQKQKFDEIALYLDGLGWEFSNPNPQVLFAKPSGISQKVLVTNFSKTEVSFEFLGDELGRCPLELEEFKIELALHQEAISETLREEGEEELEKDYEAYEINRKNPEK